MIFFGWKFVIFDYKCDIDGVYILGVDIFFEKDMFFGMLELWFVISEKFKLDFIRKEIYCVRCLVEYDKVCMDLWRFFLGCGWFW